MTQDLTKLRDEECVPVARELLRLIANDESLLLGQYTKDEQIKAYKKLYTDTIEPFLREKNVKIHDLSYIFAILLQPVENSKMTTIDSMNDALDAVIEKKLGIEEKDVRVSDIIRIQSEPVDKTPSQAA